MITDNKIYSIASTVFDRQVEALRTHSESLYIDFLTTLHLLDDCSGNIVVSGVGKSSYIGKNFSSKLRSIGLPSFFLDATEAMHGDLGGVSVDDIIISLSYSGKTGELLHLLENKVLTHNIKIAITSQNSPLSSISDVTIPLKSIEEGDKFNKIPSTSNTVMAVYLDALIACLIETKNLSLETLSTYHPGGSLYVHKS